jgi:PAS domain S-box-containing protein/putative nucleotidyltransferase with HDIG domain
LEWFHADDSEVTSLVQAEQHSREWFEALVEHSSDLIAVLDEQGSLVYANPAISSILGISQEEAVGRNVFQYAHPDDRDRIMSGHAQLVHSPGASRGGPVRFVGVDGAVRVLEVLATNCLEEDGIAGVVVNGRDVTDRDHYLMKWEASFDAITLAIANVVELRDPYTAGHQRQVADIATAIARELALPDDDIKGIHVAATLHDIGKTGIPVEILVRPGKLSPAEFEIIKAHPQVGHDIVADVMFPWPVAQMILQHHERLDGSGYPDGLKGSAILIGSRILAVADVISAISSRRPYRAALGIPAALAEIDANRGLLYDTDAVDACLRLFSERHFELVPST